MKNTYIDKATLAGELEEGIEQGQFKVYFQPVVDVMTGKIASAESLIRWFHPEKGFISPGVFIPALEDSGHISELAREEMCGYFHAVRSVQNGDYRIFLCRH